MHAAMTLGHVKDPLYHLVAFPVDFFFSRSSIAQKMICQKILGLFVVRKVPESQNHAKTSKFAS
jgi:hypothetical protein